MRMIKFIILITFLFNSAAYPYQNTSDTLRSNLMTGKGKEAQRLQDMAAQVILKGTKSPSAGPVTDAYNAAKAGNYDKAYGLLMEGLLGEDYVVNIETAIGVLQVLQAHYGTGTRKGNALGGILKIVAKYKTGSDQAQMKVELKQFQGFLLEYAKKAIEERFKTTKERKEAALELVRNLAMRLVNEGYDSLEEILRDDIPKAANAVKNIDELEKLLLSIEILVKGCVDRGIYDRSIYFAVSHAIEVWKQYESFRIKYKYIPEEGYETYEEGYYYETREWVVKEYGYYEIYILPPMFPMNLINRMRKRSRDQL